MKKKLLVGVAGLAAVALVGGTFAYFTQTTTVENPFDTGYYRTVVTENFDPSDGENWDPGVEVDKDIYVENTGDRPVVVRVKFEEAWSRNGETFKTQGQGNAPLPPYQADETDGKWDADDSVVIKKWNGLGGAWSNLQYDAWFYYTSVLDAGEQTPKLLDSVKLIDNLDLGHFQSKVYYTIGDKNSQPKFDESTWTLYGDPIEGKVSTVTAAMMDAIKANAGEIEEGKTLYTTVVVDTVPGEEGYSNADYVLTITIETVQATDTAVQNAFFDGSVPTDSDLKAIYDGWGLKAESLAE